MNGADGRATGPLVFIGGTSRSGSTLLECLLSSVPGVTVLGEVVHLWRRGIVADELCACGEPFSACPFWTEVGVRAFGGWDQVDVDHVLALGDRVDRQRRMLSTGRRHPASGIARAAGEYASYYRRIYDAARDITDATVVVDSSKAPPTALCLTYDDAVDLRMLHIVRDSRGVAYSWKKSVARPETRGQEAMPRLGVAVSTEQWLSHNLSVALVAHRGAPVSRMRYEDLVEDAAGTVARSWRELGLPGDGRVPMIDRTTVELTPTHSVAGNPMRFALGRTTLRPDDAWREHISTRDRIVVTAATYPVLRAMGYRGRR